MGSTKKKATPKKPSKKPGNESLRGKWGKRGRPPKHARAQLEHAPEPAPSPEPAPAPPAPAELAAAPAAATPPGDAPAATAAPDANGAAASGLPPVPEVLTGDVVPTEEAAAVGAARAKRLPKIPPKMIARVFGAKLKAANAAMLEAGGIWAKLAIWDDELVDEFIEPATENLAERAAKEIGVKLDDWRIEAAAVGLPAAHMLAFAILGPPSGEAAPEAEQRANGEARDG